MLIAAAVLGEGERARPLALAHVFFFFGAGAAQYLEPKYRQAASHLARPNNSIAERSQGGSRARAGQRLTRTQRRPDGRSAAAKFPRDRAFPSIPRFGLGGPVPGTHSQVGWMEGRESYDQSTDCDYYYCASALVSLI